MLTGLAKDCIYYRARHDLTQVQLAKICGVDRTIIIDIEHERPVSKLTEAKVRIAINAEEYGGKELEN